MYKNPLRILLTLLVIGAVVIGIACEGSTSNVSNSNQAANTAAADLGACELKLDEAERAALQAKIEKAIREKGFVKKLKKSLDGEGTNPPWFKFTLRKSPGANDMYYEAIFVGAVAGNGQLEELADILNDFNGKKECVRRAVFLPAGTTTLAADQRAEGFEWSACDYPHRPCSDGTCGC